MERVNAQPFRWHPTSYLNQCSAAALGEAMPFAATRASVWRGSRLVLVLSHETQISSMSANPRRRSELRQRARADIPTSSHELKDLCLSSMAGFYATRIRRCDKVSNDGLLPVSFVTVLTHGSRG